MIIEFLEKFLFSLYTLFLEMAPYMMLGMLLVGILNTYVRREIIAKYIGKKGFWPVVLASIIGVPLPLCSCGVVPAAIEVKKAGASDGAVVSFLVSTPQTGVDSIIATAGLMGWAMAIFRPIAAFISGIVTGFVVNGFTKGDAISTDAPLQCCHEHGEAEHSENTAHGECHCEHEQDCENLVLDEKETQSDCCAHRTAPPKSKFLRIFTYGFGTFLDDIVIHFIIGLAVAALITALIPDDFFLGLGLSGGILSMIVMALIGIPMYICSTSSIPVALSLMAKGLSMGAGFVFLFAGPVTNIASLTVLAKVLGKKVLGIYIGCVFVMAIIFGLIFDVVADALKLTFEMKMAHEHGGTSVWIYILGGIFLAIMLVSLYRVIRNKFKVKAQG